MPALTYLLSAILEIAPLFASVDASLTQYVALLVLLLTVASVILVLLRIYNAYMRICMPNQKSGGEKKSKSKLVEAFRRHERERQQEYIDYKNSKRKGKK